MKKITFKLCLVIVSCLSLVNLSAQDCGGFFYITSNAGWSNSEWYQIVDIDAATLTDAALPKFTASDGAKNAIDSDFGSGVFTTPIYTYNETTSSYEPTSVMWPIKYNMSAFAPTMYTSAWSKINLIGSNPSGNPASTIACTFNDNSVLQSNIFDKPGFIELSRLAATAEQPTVSRHGYIEIDDLPAVERIQWSYSSTSWKRGVKADINYNDGNGWQPLRWVASDYSSWEATFSEQGYQFEEMINKQDDPDSKISFRIGIWDGDSIHFKVNANDLSLQETTYTNSQDPLGQKQTVRVHQIKIFSGVVPDAAPNAVKYINTSDVRIYLSGNEVSLSEEANVEMYTIEGKRIYSGFTDKINVSNLSKGIYILKAVDASGKFKNQKISI